MSARFSDPAIPGYVVTYRTVRHGAAPLPRGERRLRYYAVIQDRATGEDIVEGPLVTDRVTVFEHMEIFFRNLPGA